MFGAAVTHRGRLTQIFGVRCRKGPLRPLMPGVFLLTTSVSHNDYGIRRRILYKGFRSSGASNYERLGALLSSTRVSSSTLMDAL